MNFICLCFTATGLGWEICSRACATPQAAGAHTAPVGAAHPLRCDAHAGGAPQNSLRALCALRSNSCGEHVHEACCACLPRPCASRRRRDRPCGLGPGASQKQWWCSHSGAPKASQQSRVRPGPGAPLRRRVAQNARPRAQRASSSDLSRLFERRAHSAQSELRDGPGGRATQGSRRAAVTAAVKRWGLGARGFAALQPDRTSTHPGHTQSTTQHKAPTASEH
jgi:hypothetical protein